MPCCVPGCTNLVQEWSSQFPRDDELLARWTAAIEAGTGQYLSGESNALVCNMHFGVKDTAAKYWEPSLFFRNNILLEVSWCRLCFRFEAIDKLLDMEDCLRQGDLHQWMSKTYAGFLQYGIEHTEEVFFCKTCSARIAKTDDFQQELYDAAIVHEKLQRKMDLENMVKSKASNQINQNEAHTYEPASKGYSNEGKSMTCFQPIIVKNEIASSRMEKANPIKSLNKSIETTLNIFVKVEPSPSNMEEHTEPLSRLPEISNAAQDDVIVEKKTKPAKSNPLLKSTEKNLAERKNTRNCFICDTFLESVDSLICHLMMEHKAVESLRCEECNLSFKKIILFNAHLAKHDVKRPLKCDHCSLRFNRRVEKRAHEAKQHGDTNSESWRTELKCKICDKPFSTRLNLEIHVKVQHRGESYAVCGICNQSFNSKGAHDRHVLIHGNEKPYKCKLCDASYVFKYQLVAHIAESHTDSNGPNHNPNQRVYNTQPGIWKKPRLVNGKPVVSRNGGASRKDPVCNLCQVVFEHSKELVSHFKEIHTDMNLRYYPCTECDDLFFTSSNLLTHSVRHTARFSCDLCEKNLCNKEALVNHRHSIHGEPLDEDQYVNCPVCGERFRRYSFIRHLRSHEKRVYRCETCNQNFRELHLLRAHRKLHTEEKPLICSDCGKRYSVPASLSSHRRVCKANVAGTVWRPDFKNSKSLAESAVETIVKEETQITECG